MKVSLGFSPCPNDTFIFDALVNHKIDTGGLSFEVFMEDVQTLNEWALAGKLQFSKISYGVLPLILSQYSLLTAGGALGHGVGPLLISRSASAPTDQIETATIAIPGENTTAHILFSKAFPQARHKKFMPFHEIENAVLSGAVDYGVIIHENRFTYAEKGLHKVIDLGDYWQQTTQSAIPLGGIVAHRSVSSTIGKQLNQLIQQSIAYSYAQLPTLSEFIQVNAQEMLPGVMQQHIDLYVNDFSVDLGDTGKKAVDAFLNEYEKIHGLRLNRENLYLV